MKVTATARPFLLVFPAGGIHRVSSEEAQRILDVNTIVAATRGRVTISDGGSRHFFLLPATAGGGAAFEVSK